ncbi:hypothetical protein GQ457_03G003430 [Hibiscus cannabinus]
MLAIDRLRKRNWETEISWIPRDGNQVADMLAKLTDSSALELVELCSPPEYLLSLIHSDTSNSSLGHN